MAFGQGSLVMIVGRASATNHRAMQRVVLALRRGFNCERFHCYVVAPRKALGRARSGRFRRSGQDLLTVFLPLGKFGSQHQPARRAIEPHCARLKSVLAEEVLKQPAEVG
jgi:hypothetical protein